MKTDKENLNEGQEKYSECTVGEKRIIWYRYRHVNGQLFGVAAGNLDAARSKRDKWLDNMEADFWPSQNLTAMI